MDDRGTIPLEYHFPQGSKIQHMVGSSSELNVQANSPQLFSLPVESFTLRNQAGKEPLRNQNEFSAASQTNNGNFHATSNGPLQAYSFFTPTDAPNLFPLSQSCNAWEGNSELSLDLQDLMRFGNMNCVNTDSLPLEICNLRTESSRPLELPRQSIVKADGSVSSVAYALTEQREIDGFLQNEAQLGSTSFSYSDNHKESDLGYRDIKTMENLEVSDIKDLENFLKDNALANSCDTSAKIADGHVQRTDQSPDSLTLDEKCELHARRLAATAAEKFWEGSLQLNSSVTVSAVAYFKSGERIPDVNWTKFVEVKGKVRLEAFEKYIQDLPRSRNRGLMVVSLYWKNGSSETGLTGMKEVGKKYQEGDKVGLAQLSSGVDLYICPRSETIITILAKYGFFKGMSAIEDNQDSLIGCVVWRKNHSVNPVAKIPDRDISLSNPPTSASASPSQQTSELSLSSAQSAQNSSQTVSVTKCTTVENTEKQTIDSSNIPGKHTIVSKNIESHKVQIKGGISSSLASSPPAPPFSINWPSTSLGHQTSPPSNSTTIPSAIRQMKVEAPFNHNSGPEKSLGLEMPELCHRSDVTKPPVSAINDDDDDDLPEFDFRVARKVPQTLTRNPLDVPKPDMRPAAEMCQKMDASLPEQLRIVKGMTLPNHSTATATLPRHPINGNPGMPPSKRARECESQLPLPKWESTPFSTTTLAARRKNLFDDDDMPEWQPPVHNLQNESVAETTKSSSGFVPTKTLNSTRDSPHLGFPQTLHPSSSATMCRPIYPHTFPVASSCPINVALNSTQPRPASGHVQRGSGLPMGSNSIPLWRPPPPIPSDVKLPFHPPGWSRRKPF